MTIERSAAGAGTWVDGLHRQPLAVQLPAGRDPLADGSYDLRAVARDGAGNSRTSSIVAARIVDNNGPTVTLAPTASDVRGVIALTATATDAGTGMASVRFERSLADADTWSTVCTDASSPYSCSLDTNTLANDLYDFQAVALDLAGNATTSALVADVQVDNAVPFGVAVTAPASPLRGAVTLTATADDDDSGVATVTLQRRTGAGAFVDICTTSADPFSCTLVTTAGATPDGTYDLRAIAVDAAGNTTTSSTVSRQIDNSQPSVSLVDPGAYLRGTVTLTANAYTGSGVTSVSIQRAPADGTHVHPDLQRQRRRRSPATGTRPAWPARLYDLRAVMTYAGGTDAGVGDRQRPPRRQLHRRRLRHADREPRRRARRQGRGRRCRSS